MFLFKTRKIFSIIFNRDNKNRYSFCMIRLGQRLREVRIGKGISLEEVSRATKIKIAFLSAIEDGMYEKLPSSSYAQGFVKNYVQFLGFSEREAMALFRREFDEKRIFKVLPDGLVSPHEFHPSKRIFQQTTIIVLSVFVVLIGYIFFQNRYVFINPPLEVITPIENAVLDTTRVMVSGRTDQNASVFVNGEPAFIDKDGSFQKNVTFFSGKETLEVTAVNRFGKETKVKRHIEIKE